MPRASYTLNSEHLGYFFLVMIMVMFMILILIYAALTANPTLIVYSFLLFGVVGLIIMVLVWMRKISYEPKKIPDYSLKNK